MDKVALQWQIVVLSSIEACVVSIRANTHDFNKLMKPEHAAEAERIYNDLLVLQQKVLAD